MLEKYVSSFLMTVIFCVEKYMLVEQAILYYFIGLENRLFWNTEVIVNEHRGFYGNESLL